MNHFTNIISESQMLRFEVLLTEFLVKCSKEKFQVEVSLLNPVRKNLN